MKHIINKEHELFNFYLQLPSTVHVGTIHTSYKTAPMEIIPGTPCIETEWPAHPHLKCSGGWFNSTQPLNTCRTSNTTLAVSGYTPFCRKSACLHTLLLQWDNAATATGTAGLLQSYLQMACYGVTYSWLDTELPTAGLLRSYLQLAC